MNPAKVDRNHLVRLTDLPNVGPATEADFRLLGFEPPGSLVGQDPYNLFNRLCRMTGVRHDPCVIDVFLSVEAFLKGGPPQPWWAFTEIRKASTIPNGWF